MEEQSLNDNLNFNKRLMEVIGKSNDEFMEFIDEELHPGRSKNVHKIAGNIDSLKRLNINQQLIVKARAKEFEEDNDLSKYVTPMIALFGFIAATYSVFSELIPNKTFAILFNVAIMALFGFGLIKVYQTLKYQRSSAVFFNNLISNIKFREDSTITQKELKIAISESEENNELSNTSEVHQKT